MKILCGGCNMFKPRDQFNKSSSTINGLQHYCRRCQRIKHRKWEKDNPELHRATVLRAQKNNKAKTNLRAALWRKKNPEAVRRAHKKWRLKKLASKSSI